MRKTVNFSELNKLINQFQAEKDLPQRNAILILKSDCGPRRGGEIRLEDAVEIINERTESCEKLALIFENNNDDDMALFQHQKVENLNNVIHLVFKDPEKEEEVDGNVE